MIKCDSRVDLSFGSYFYFPAKHNQDSLNFCLTRLSERNSESSKLRILDLGCGNRPFDDLIRTKLSGYEIEFVAVDFNSQSATHKGNFNTILPQLNDRSFNLIILSETLEHVFDPVFILKQCFRLLEKNGMIFISVPFMFQVHGTVDFYRYTPLCMEELFKQSNLKIVISNHLDDPFLVINSIIQQILYSGFRFFPVLRVPFSFILNFIFYFFNIVWKLLRTVGSGSIKNKYILSSVYIGEK